VLDHFREAQQRGIDLQKDWEAGLEAYRKAFPEEATQLMANLAGDLPEGWDNELDDLFKDIQKPVATRAASGTIMNKIAMKVSNLIGGSADLAPSNKTLLNGFGDYGVNGHSGRNIHFGVREHAMGSIASGMALHGGIIPYTATFLVFYDYMRPPVRLAALMGIRVIYIFSHDSIFVGEDGPTHQPIEQIMGLRQVPNLVTLRPADATEAVEAWKIALERRHGPTAILTSRQGLQVFDRKQLAPADDVKRGAYILWQASSQTEVILIGTGSEVHIALEAGRTLAENDIKVRVVSMPSWELFDAQPPEYRNHVLPPEVKARISIEAGQTIGWERYVGLEGKVIGISRFGESAPGKIVAEKLGVTVENTVTEALKLLKRD
jgi:transketolase